MTIKVDAAWWVGEILQDPVTSIFAVTAGLGSGKTHGDCQIHHYLVEQNRNSRFSGFLEPTFQKIADAAIPTYEKILNACGYSRGVDYKILKSPYPKLIYLNHPKQHEVHFLSAENPEKIVAVEYSHATADEAGILDWEAVRNLRTRVRCSEAKRRQTVLSGAPQGLNDFASEFDSDTLPDWDCSVKRDHFKERFVEGVLVKHRRFTLWTDDNKRYLPAEYIPTLVDTYGHNPNLIKSYRYGMFCTLTEGVAVSNYMPQRHDLGTNRKADPYKDFVLSFDFNANPCSWVAIQKQPFEDYERRVNRYVVIEEASGTSGQLVDAVVEFAAKFPVQVFRDTKISIFGDRSGHGDSHKIEGSDYDTIYQTLRELGYKNVEICATKKVAPEHESIEAVQRLFLKNLLCINPKCKNLKRSFFSSIWKKGIRKLHKPSGETHTHWLDALKYWAWQETYEETSNLIKVYGANI